MTQTTVWNWRYMGTKAHGFLVSISSNCGWMKSLCRWKMHAFHCISQVDGKKIPWNFWGLHGAGTFLRFHVFLWKKKPRWWFQMFSNFTYTSGSDPIWLIFFRWVETTNQFCVYKTLFFHFLIYLEPSLQSPIYQVTRPLVPIFLGNWKMRDGVIDILPNGLTYTQVN